MRRSRSELSIPRFVDEAGGHLQVFGDSSACLLQTQEPLQQPLLRVNSGSRHLEVPERPLTVRHLHVTNEGPRTVVSMLQLYLMFDEWNLGDVK